ncbi:mitochondrial GTPase 1 [Diorhabda sublineata]|uniref:mitochondrial GTPase 1 n=1 Tax=Diorhabda sublineata TaxID=1163346 RepID=UPI0024E0FFCF|nr:mitochondrial GTPase 1 [Diorhabda sublineata]
MSNKVVTNTFRSVFKTVDKELLRWFPGHMEKGLKQMQNKIRSVDCLIEVHDARIPLSGRNADFKYTVSGVKPHILVLNKVDLIDRHYQHIIEEKLKNEYQHIIFTHCRNQDCPGIKQIFPLAQKLINQSDRFNRIAEEDYNIMIIGIPNVGKSSVINALRVKYLNKGKATSVGATPGVTRSVLHKIKLSDKPLFYMFDTPGILSPTISSVETGLKLTLCATMADHFVGERILSDYLLYWLNKNNHFDYVTYFGLSDASDNILEVLTHIAKSKKKNIRLRDQTNNYIIRPDLDGAAQIMLRAFRVGNLGKIMLDEDLLV